MAQAVKRLWPEVQLAIGPAIDEGWYYDFDAPFAFTPDHLSKIEAEMKKIVKERIRLERSEKSREDAIAWAEANNEPYKKELIEDLPADAVISFYTPPSSGRSSASTADHSANKHDNRKTSQLLLGGFYALPVSQQTHNSEFVELISRGRGSQRA